MKLNNIALLAWAGVFAGSVGLTGACGSGAKGRTTNGTGDNGNCGNGVVDVGEECDGDACCDPATCTKKPGCTSMSSTGAGMMHVCGNGAVEAPEQCDDGKAKNGMNGDPCRADCTKDPNSKCGNGIVEPNFMEECDLGAANSCVDMTMSACTCTCKNKKCGDGVVQSGECCDDANGGGSEQMSKCTADCKGCKNPMDPACKCGGSASSSSTGIDCSKAKIFKAVVSSQANPAMQGGGIPSGWSYAGFQGLKAGQALCQAVGADHVCTYDEVVAADAKMELAGIPNNLTYWLHRTKNVPDYSLNNGMKACNQAADCGVAADACDAMTKVCSWKPGAGGRCNDWTYTTNHISDGEWFKVGADTGGVLKGSLSFHFLKDTTYDGVTAPVCKSETQLGCAGACAGPSRAILCCFPACNP